MNEHKLKMLNGFVNLNTISLEGNYYQITKPEEKVMGVFMADIAYFDQNDKKVYVTPKEAPGSDFMFSDTFNNVMWLCNGKVALHIEYNRNESQICLVFFEELLISKLASVNGDSLFEKIHLLKKMEYSELEEYSKKHFMSSQINYEETERRYNKGFFRKWYP